ncbi:MAG: hypothetical protein ACUVQ1_05975 [Candidatus Kapaibacteriales bacterium]
MKVISLIVLMSFFGVGLFARPQYSILQTYGAKCSACHLNIQGGGVRTISGWLSRKDISLIKPEWIGLKNFFEAITTQNTFLNDKILFGFDTRVQSARWPKGATTTQRDYMLMQATPYLVITPFNWMWLEAFYNIAYDLENSKRYSAQQPYSFSLYLKPFEYLPSVRAGFFQPPIGQKWDDHTLFVRSVIGQFSKHYIVPDDYADFGIQLDYENISWLSLSAGVFSGKNLSKLTSRDINSKTISIVDTNSIGFAGRGMYIPEFIQGINSYIGGTFYINDDYYITSAFLGAGLSDRISVIGEYVRSEKKNSRLTLSFLADITYQLTDSFLPFIRAERSILKDKDQNNPIYATALTFGSHIVLLPSLDLLIEYRVLDREHMDGYSAQWAFQIHFYY